MKAGIALGFILGAPIWFSAGAALMGRLCAAARDQAERELRTRKAERTKQVEDWDWSRP